MSVIIGNRNYIRNAVIEDNGESIQNIENDGIIIDGKKIPPCPCYGVTGGNKTWSL